MSDLQKTLVHGGELLVQHRREINELKQTILELDERLKRVEAFIGNETEGEFLAFIQSLPKPKVPTTQAESLNKS